MDAKLRRLGGWLLCVPVAAVGLAGCATKLHPTGSANPLTTTAEASTSTSTPTSTTTTSSKAQDAGAGSGSGSGSGTGSGSGSGSGSGNGGTTQPTAKVVSLTVVEPPSCPVVGTPEAPFSAPGNPVKISWKVSGADGAAIGVDNPGTYGAYGSDYPKTGSETFQFGCSGTTGESSHKFTVWPKGHPEISKTITVSAKNNP